MNIQFRNFDTECFQDGLSASRGHNVKAVWTEINTKFSSHVSGSALYADLIPKHMLSKPSLFIVILMLPSHYENEQE